MGGGKKKRREAKSVKIAGSSFGSASSKNFRKNGLVVTEGAVSLSTDEQVQWRKILYEKQPFPDNYCSPKFLTELQMNVTAITYTFDEAVRGSLILMHQVNSVVLYVISFAFVRGGFIHWHVLLLLCIAVAVVGYFIYFALIVFGNRGQRQCHHSIRQTIKTLALYIGFGYGLSPVFKTLTETISTDTIYALATFMFVMNVAFADYGVDVAIVSSALSLNAGIFGAVCLISRLSSSNEVFSLLTGAVETFVLWPILRRELLTLHPRINVFLAVISAVMVTAGLRQVSSLSMIAYLLLHIFVSLACPWGLMKMQPLKSTIHGPWDEAVVVT